MKIEANGNIFMGKIKEFLKKETVLCVALVLAVVSAFFVAPDKKYIDYIDFHTLAILFSLMCVMAGLQRNGVFQWIAEAMLRRVKTSSQLVTILMVLCFAFSMLITNDVALITFVPFTFTVLAMLDKDKREALMIPVVVIQTIAANLGSMLTPIGNPQNLYLYGRAGMSVGEFFKLMCPYACLSFLLLQLVCIFLCKGDKTQMNITFAQATSLAGKGKTLAVYVALFVVCLLTVAHIVPYWMTLLIVLVVVFFMDKKVLTTVDYSLLLTFVGFFIFIGNMGRIPAFCEFLQGIVVGNEAITAIVASQAISNVPAALLLSGFTAEYEALIIGVNLGGLGTLIASMASLISYKYLVKEAEEKKGAYFKYFTIMNVAFLVILVAYMMLLRG